MPGVARKKGGRTRRVWVWGDSHIGREGGADDRHDGTEWLEVAVADARRHMRPVDYVIALGDLTNRGHDEHLARYAAIRDRSGVGPWFELAGNHDYWAWLAKRWDERIRPLGRAVIEDGNAVWIMFSVERDGAAGRISEETLAWLRRTARRYRDRNVIVCSHQPVHRTVSGSRKDTRSLFCSPVGTAYHPGRVPKRELRRIGRMLEEVRVDLWLCGHFHSGPRDAGYVARKGRTVFINVASICHAYGTGACRSFLLRMRQGSRMMEALCRRHDGGGYDSRFGVWITFPFPWRFGSGPKLTYCDTAVRGSLIRRGRG